MSIEIKIPELQEGVDSVEVSEVFVSEGEQVDVGQDIAELEADKGSITLTSDHSGAVTKIHINEGDTLSIGDVLLTLEAAAGSPAPAQPKSAPEPAVVKEPVPQQPDPAQQPEPAQQPVQQAASAPVEPATPVQAVTPAQPVTPVRTAPASPPPSAKPAVDSGSIAAGPAIRRLAREVGVDLATVQGTGPSGRITRDDVLGVVRQLNQGGGQAANSTVLDPNLPGDPSSDAWGPVHVHKLPRIRKTIAAKMHESWQTCPRVTNFDDADVTDLENFRQSSKADYASKGVKLTSMPFVIKAVATALRDHPTINASIDMDQGVIVYKQYVNVGVAVDTDRGLMVPSLRSADQLSIPEMAAALGEIANKARDNNISIEDMRGSTFTISNLGAIGGTYSTPIINTPEVAILLVGRSRKMPVVLKDGTIAPRLMMPLSLSYDHRLVDGGAAARFLNDVIGYLEAPSRLLLAP